MLVDVDRRRARVNRGTIMLRAECMSACRLA